METVELWVCLNLPSSFGNPITLLRPLAGGQSCSGPGRRKVGVSSVWPPTGRRLHGGWDPSASLVWQAAVDMWGVLLRAVGSFLFLPISLWNRICLPNQARPSAQWASRSPGCLVPSALFPRACAQGEVGTLEVEIVRASPGEPGGHGGCPGGCRSQQAWLGQQGSSVRRETGRGFLSLQGQCHLHLQMPFTLFINP